MKILQVVHEFPTGTRGTGGTGIYTYNLAKELSKRHEVSVFYPVNKTHKKPYTLEKKEQDGLHLIEINNRSSYLKAINPEFTYKNKKIDEKFETLVNEIKPDIVHFHHFLNLSFNLLMLSKKAGIPVVLTLADYWLICHYSAHLLNSKANICKFPSPEECTNCYINNLLDAVSKKTKLILFKNSFINTILKGFFTVRIFKKRFSLAREVIEKADIVISPSESVKLLVLKYLHVNKGVKIIHHGVETEMLRKIKQISPNNLRFGYIGNMGKRKGLYLLIKAFNTLEYNNIELQIYGISTSEQQLIETFCLNKKHNIKIMGRFSNVSEPFSNIDVLVVPSITYEGYGLVVQEAFASNTPVIASDIGALNEFVKHMKNGLLFRVGDANDLAEKMRTIAENPNLLYELKKGIPQIKSVKQYAKELEEIYREKLINRT